MASNIIIKTPEQIEKLRVAGKIAAEVLEMIEPHVQAGITTEELDDIMLRFIEDDKHSISACLGYHGYPKCTCISVNEVVCHGIPGKHKLHNGDIVNIDVTVIKDGFHGDTSKMFIVGQTSPRNHQLVKVTQNCLYEAIRAMGPGKNLTEVGRVIEGIAKKEGFSIVRDYCGHGIGEGFHEEPQVVHYYPNPYSVILKPGMVFTIEPMLNAGTWRVKVNRKDGWTVTTADKQPSAQFEHTIVITETGCEVLTLRQEEEETLGRYITAK